MIQYVQHTCFYSWSLWPFYNLGHWSLEAKRTTHIQLYMHEWPLWGHPKPRIVRLWYWGLLTTLSTICSQGIKTHIYRWSIRVIQTLESYTGEIPTLQLQGLSMQSQMHHCNICSHALRILNHLTQRMPLW